MVSEIPKLDSKDCESVIIVNNCVKHEKSVKVRMLVYIKKGLLLMINV